MYNASELFIIKDVLEIYTQQKQNNECMFITTCLESRAADDHKVKKFTEFLPCAFAMYDCRQLEDVSSVEMSIWYRSPSSGFYQVLSPQSSIIK